MEELESGLTYVLKTLLEREIKEAYRLDNWKLMGELINKYVELSR